MENFLAKDRIGLQDNSFSSTKFIAELLIKKQSIQDVYNQYIQQENECEELIGQIVDDRYAEFNPLIDKPTIYGRAYERLAKNTRQNRRRIAKCKELLQSKSVDLKQTYLQSVYNKDIVLTLNRLQNIKQSINTIDLQVQNNGYDACLEYRKAKMQLDGFDRQQQKSLMVCSLQKQLNQASLKILNELRQVLKEFFIGQKSQYFTDQAEQYYQASQKISQATKTSEVAQIFKDTSAGIPRKDNTLLKLCLEDQSINENKDALQQVTYTQLKKFIEHCFQFNDFEQVKNLLISKTNKLGDVLMSHSFDASLISVLLLVKGAVLLKESNQLLNGHFEDFKMNMQDFFTFSLVSFLDSQLHSASTCNDLLFNQVHFTDMKQYQSVAEFFKLLIAHAVILLRKQILFGKILHHLQVDVDENTMLLSLGELLRQLFWQINVILSLFYKNDGLKKRDRLDTRNEVHLFLNAVLRNAINPSPLYFLFQQQLIEEALESCIDGLKCFMKQEPMFKEPLENEQMLQRELSRGIFEGCFKELFEGVKSVTRNIISAGHQKRPVLNYNSTVECGDEQLRDLLLNQNANLQIYHKQKMVIIESIQLSGLLNSMTIIQNASNLSDVFIHMINWVLTVYHQEFKTKLKSLITGSLSEILLCNTDKVGVLKKLLSYLQWKVTFQQSSELLNDGINTAARLEKAVKDKAFKQLCKQAIYTGYKEYLVGKTTYNDEQLIRSKETLHSLGALHQNIHAFLTVGEQAFRSYLFKVDCKQLIAQLDLQAKDIPTDDSLASKIQVIRTFQLRCEQSQFTIEQLKQRNALESQFKDTYQQGMFRFTQLFNQILDIQRDTYCILRFEFHLRCLQIGSIQDFYFDYHNFTTSLKESMLDEHVQFILADFWMLFKTSLKAQFIRGKDFNAKKVAMLIKDLNVLREDLRQVDPLANKKIMMLRRYFKLHLVVPTDLEKFLKLNPFKYKYDVVVEYCQLREISSDILRKYCL